MPATSIGAPTVPDQVRNLRCTLAHTLGFGDYPRNTTADPYLDYISNHQLGRQGLESYLKLFIQVIQHFQSSEDSLGRRDPGHTIAALMARLEGDATHEMFADSVPGSRVRMLDVEDNVMYILGVWTMMLSAFVLAPNRLRRICVAFNTHTKRDQSTLLREYKESLEALVRGSRLLPARGRRDETKIVEASRPAANQASGNDSFELDDFGDSDDFESTLFKATRLNAWRLHAIAGVEIEWTSNISRHMLLSQRSGRHLLETSTRHVLEVFALPCALAGSGQHVFGVQSELVQEIFDSYAVLFNAWPVPTHGRYGRFIGVQRFCWCWACSAQRYKKEIILACQGSASMSTRKTFDPLLKSLMENEASNWTFELFPCLWSRVTTLERHLHTARPKSIWILLRDRRDTLQYWTFLFATVVVCLTILQVLLGIAQVVGSFHW